MTGVCIANRASLMEDNYGRGVRYLAVLALLLWPAVSAADFLNGSFEQSYSITPRPDSVAQYWRLRNADYTMFGSQVTSVWKTDGLRSVGLFSRYGRSFAAGNYQGIYQMVDLTGMAELVFDVRLASYGSTTFAAFDNFEAALLVDEVPLWRQTADGAYLDQHVDVSTLPGLHYVELRITAKTAGQFNVADWVQWDNLRMVKAPEEKIIEAVIDVDPNTLNLNSKGNWITCYIELPTGYDVNDIAGDTVTLENVQAHMGKEGWASPQANAGNTMDHDGDGVLERMVKFDRSAVQAVLRPGVVTVTVMGKLPNHTKLHGTDVIKVMGKGGDQK
jgi:hypothetical protein